MNYFVHGIGQLFIAMNMHSLQLQWGTDAAGVSLVISSLGLGRFAVLYLAGTLSDRFGRMPFIFLGMALYILFFLGIVNTETLVVAYLFGFLAGCANSFLDAGSYPLLMEMFPKAPGPAVIMVKAFVAVGQFLMPFLISTLMMLNLWFGWSAIVMAGILVVNVLTLFTLSQKLPQRAHRRAAQGGDDEREGDIALPDLLAYAVFGYIAMGTFYCVSQWLTAFGEVVAGMSPAEALQLVSIYTSGSLAGVFGSSLALKTFLKPRVMLMLCTAMSTCSLALGFLFPTPEGMTVFAFVFGFFAAGGVLQLGLSLLAAQFPRSKGKATGIYYTAGSIANFTLPLIAAWIARAFSIRAIWAFDAALAFAGFVLACFIAARSRQSEQGALEAPSA